MAGKKRSQAWNYFEKIDYKRAKCKICLKILRMAGNTTNLLGHIKNIHKSVDLEAITIKSVKKEIDPLSPCPGTSVKELDEDIEFASTNFLNPELYTYTSAEETAADLHVDNDCEADLPSKRLKIQQPIKATYEEINSYTSSGDEAREINNAILYMICKDNQPISVVENEGFKNLFEVTCPDYKIPSRASVKRWLDHKYDVLSTLLKSKLPKVDHLTLTTDIWSDMVMRSFLGVTAHFGLNTEFQSVTLGVYQLDEGHTSEYIAQMLKKTCNDWGLDTNKVSAVVTDDAANLMNAVEIGFGKTKHIPCFAHTLNLIAQNSLQIPELENITSKIRNIVVFFKQSCAASGELRNSVVGEAKLIQDVPRRWTSTYYMIQRYLELKSAVSDVLTCHKNAPPMLTASELNISSSLIEVLRPLEAATKEISGDTYCTSSIVIPLAHCMNSKLKAIVIYEPLIIQVHRNILAEMRKRLGPIEQVSSLAIATLLDPRFKKLHFKDPIACERAIGKIKDLMMIYPESDSNSLGKVSEDFCLWSDHHNLVHRNWKTTQNEGSVSDELSLYLRTPVGRLSENPFEIWSEFKQEFPKLYKIANKYLSVVASSVPPESLFSEASQVLNRQRNIIQGKRVHKILFLQSLEKKYWDV